MSKAKVFLDSWLRHRLVTNDIIEMVTDKDLDFKPWEGAMSLKELTLHIVQSGDIFVRATQLGAVEKPSEVQEITTAEELKQVVRNLTANSQSNLESLTDEQLDNLIDVTNLFGTHLPGHVLLNMMRDHEIHHKGQLFIYARMIGLENLPLFVKHQL
ncbi:DinB family protein [Anaerobacillus alkaliphilus]|nr:DinB family protein [Anaerobacillus alkaliphilus]